MNAQDLKNSILQLAIQGKLIEQRKEEGTAKELFEQIKLEKEQLIKEKKIKKETPLSEITEDQIPFDIPESWKWVRLGNICEYIQRGKSPKYSEIKKHPVVAQKCNQWAGFSLEKAKFLDPNTINSYTPERFLRDGDLMWNSTGLGTLGRMAIYYVELNPYELAVADSHVTVVRTLKEFIAYKYLYYYFANPSVQSVIESQSDGSTKQKELATNTIKNYIVPLPPLEEQKRIVTKIEELMPYIEKYGEAYSKLEAFNKRFPEDMQKSILQSAIQGKLVEQREEEGTAEALYQHIQEEKARLIKEGKIKKEKLLAEITEEELPFEIPDSWKWVRIGEIFHLQAGKNIDASDIIEYQSEEYKYSCFGGNGLRGYVRVFNRNGKYALIGRQGALCGNINYAKGKFYATEHAVVVDHFDLTDVMWCGYFLKALNLNQYATATAQPGLAVGNIIKIVIPLPSLEEQKRIVVKIEELILYCHQLVK